MSYFYRGTVTGLFKRVATLSLLAIVMSFPTFTKAQAVVGIEGVVHNKEGIAISGATVQVLNLNRTAITDKNGKFIFNQLVKGIYQIAVSATGYATTVKTIDDKISFIEVTLTEASKQLDEVIVTAEKSEEQLQKLPLSITAFTSKQIQDARLLSIKDLTAFVPNLYAAHPGDNRNVVTIRGITTTSYDPTVATYIDGVNQFGLDTYIAQLEDVERIEVLRGPQGTLYGRNAMGGVINIITKQPGNETRGFAEAGFGNYNQHRYSLGLRTPLIENKLFLGLAGLYTKQHGFYTNDFNGSRFDDQHSFMGNYYMRYVANQKLAITLNIKHVENRNQGTFPLAPDPASALNDPFKVNQNTTTGLIDNIFNTSLALKYSDKAFNFSSQSTYQSNYRYYTQPIDGDFSPIDGVSIVNNYGDDFNKVKVGTQEFRFTSPADATSKFNWVTGIYGFYQNNPVKQAIHFGEDAELVGAPFANFSSITTNQQKIYGLAVYGQGNYRINPQLELILGMRYDYQHNKLSILGEFQPDGQPAMTTQPDTASAVSFKALSPKLSLAYHPTEEMNMYAGYSRGFRTGGLSQLGADPMSQPPLYAYDPENSNNFEIGIKNTLWEQRIRLNATLFYTQVNNAQVPTLILPAAITIVRNAGKLESKGAELELAVKPFQGLEADYSFGYTHASYQSLYLASNNETIDLSGNHQVFTPDVTSMFALQYNQKVGQKNNYELMARTEWRYLGDQYFDLANQIRQNAYHLFNGRIGVSTKNISLFLWAANIFNRHYIDYAYDFGASHLGNPQTFGLSVRKDF